MIDVAGHKTTGGSKVLADNIAKSDATVATRLKAGGAILIGKLNLAEFAFGMIGLNPYTGDVKTLGTGLESLQDQAPVQPLQLHPV